MKIHLSSVRNYFNDKKIIAIFVSAFIIGIGIITSINVLSKKQEPDTSSFKSLDSTLAEVGDVQGESVVASPSATLTPTKAVLTGYRNTPTSRPTVRPTSRPATNTPGSSGSSTTTSSSNPTSTPTKAPTSAATATPTVTPKPPSVTAAATFTPMPVSPSPTPTSAVTPTPGFSGSINQSVTDGTLNVSFNSNRELLLCIFHFFKDDGTALGFQDGSAGGNSCSTSRAADPSLKKIKVNAASVAGEKYEAETTL